MFLFNYVYQLVFSFLLSPPSGKLIFALTTWRDSTTAHRQAEQLAHVEAAGGEVVGKLQAQIRDAELRFLDATYVNGYLYDGVIPTLGTLCIALSVIMYI